MSENTADCDATRELCGCRIYEVGEPYICPTHWEPALVIASDSPSPCEHGVFGPHWVGATEANDGYDCGLAG